MFFFFFALQEAHSPILTLCSERMDIRNAALLKGDQKPTQGMIAH